MITASSCVQGRNFDLKVGVPIQKENEAPLGPKMRGEENGEEVRKPLPFDSGVWESVMSSSSGVRGKSPAEKRLYRNLVSTDRLC